VVLGLALVLVPALVSYAGAVLGPSNVGVGVRSVEWLRDHGLAWLVSDVERAWYSFHTPATGGAALKALPTVGVGVGLGGDAGVPAPIPPAITPALAGEGRWQRTGPLAGGRPPVLVTTFRPDLAYPRMVAGVAWIDHTRTSISLYPGRYEPASATLRGPLEVPLAARGQLVATFNSGFKLQDAHGGFAALGHADVPLVAGQATLVGYRDGRVDIRAWAGPAVPGSDVLFARQNLPLILAAGQLNPNLSDGPAWGATLGNAVRVWRSGIGINARGEPALRRSQQPDGLQSGGHPPARRGGAGHGARHQLRVGGLQRLWRGRGGGARQAAAGHDAQRHPLPQPRRPRLLRRLRPRIRRGANGPPAAGCRVAYVPATDGGWADGGARLRLSPSA